MHNMVYLIGRLNNELVMKGDTVEIELAVQRAFKNDDGIYETDFIPVKLSGQIALNTIEYIKKGDLVGIKGRIEMNDTLKVVCDKISFLASKRED